jgi:hypothetical protein
VKRCIVESVNVRALVVAGLLLMMTFSLGAAVTIIPPAPTSHDEIAALIDVSGGCFEIVTTSVTGNSIRTNIVQGGCVFGPPAFTIKVGAPFGPLAPGTYTYDVYLDYENTGFVLLARQTIVVAPAPVPAIDEVGLSLLAISLASIACLAVGKRG